MRGEGFDGDIVLIGEEAHLPYQRPPLSKDYLLGKTDRSRLQFKPDDYYGEHGVEVHTNTTVEAIDRAERCVALSDGNRVHYDRLLIATGCAPRALPESVTQGLEGIYTVRGLDDVDRLAPDLQGCARVTIVGGGFIGLEAAAVARSLGLEVVVVEALPRLLARVAAEETSEAIAELHRRHGTEILTDVGVAQLEGSGRVNAIRLTDGRALSSDIVIVGIGATPCTKLAEDAGLTVDNGIVVDAACRTSDGEIFAAGDCASFPFQGRQVRLESVQNALNQGAAAAKAMFGQDVAYAPVPWFWSDQYDAKLQIAGLNHGFDKTVLRAGKSPEAQSVWYFCGDRFVAVDAINDGRAYMVGKRWLETGKTPDPQVIADPDVKLKP